jgi:elongation factor P--beta-lysine ligase
MNKERAITYSLLAHIRNTGTLAKGPIDIFIPLIKRALSKMNSLGIFQGKSILEIKKTADDLYFIDFPIPVLKKILNEICKEINTNDKTHFVLYKDGAFSINEFTFIEFEEIIENQAKDIDELEDLFKQFCETSELKIENTESIFKFIEKNKFNLSKYISNYAAPQKTYNF